MPLGTTELGYVNRNDQMVLRKPDEPVAEHSHKLYVLRCLECEHEYSAKGSDIPEVRCVACADGRMDLTYAA